MADWTGEGVDTAARFREMALRGYADRSPSYRRLALAVADSPAVLARLGALPPARQQPNLVFGAIRLLGGPVDDPVASLDWLAGHWSEVVDVVMTHRTQTNEARRCATLLPALAAVPGPLALVEVGASAGLCLQPDRYAYRYATADGPVEVGGSSLTLECVVTGPAPLPDAVPEVVWRRGLDLHPLDVRSDDDMNWLRCLVWPEQTDRFAILTGAIETARRDPPQVVASIGELGREVVWISNESPGVVVEHPDDVQHGRFLLARDGRPVAWTGQHGHTLDWAADDAVGV